MRINLSLICAAIAFLPTLAVADDGGDRTAGLIYLIVLLLFLGGGLVGLFWQQPGRMIRMSLIWVSIFGVVFMIGAFRSDFTYVWQRLVGAAVPGNAIAEGNRLILARDIDGHFWVTAKVNGRPVRFLVDTGASVVSLSAEEAQRIGFSTRDLEFTVRVNTAGGPARAAPIRLDQIEIGPARYSRISALVVETLSEGSNLLGLSALDRLQSYRVDGDQMILVF
ncbi:MAG: TIGR02281 family clan AA aspartic protease [Pseudomonadota bacterium]